MRITDHGLSADLPTGWEAEITLGGDGTAARATDDAGSFRPVLHVANFALPVERGDFGSGAVEVMTAADLLVCLLEYEPGSASTPLFEAEGLPRVQASDFDPAAMQRTRKGMSGMQRFFHVGDRGFCLYIVVGGHLSRAARVDEINAVLDGITIDT